MKLDSTLGFISGTTTSIWFFHSVLNLFKDDHDHRFGADLMTIYGPYIHDNRNRMAAQFLSTDRQWLFMVDNDMVFEPKDVWNLFSEADERGPGVYSAAYQLENAMLVCGPWDEDIEYAYHPLLALPENPRQIGVVGAGFTLIHREVLEALTQYPFTAQGPNIGEDVAFSWRVREAGYTPWLVPACNPGHSKSVVLYPHDSVKNLVGEEVNLVELHPEEVT